jgi:HEAT repeat protein
MFSCFQKQEIELVREIRMLEFQRNADSSIFENYSDNEIVSIRLLTADAIAKIGNPVHLPVLNNLLNDKESSVVQKAIFALGQIGGQDSLLVSLLKDDRFNPYKKQIILALGLTRSDSAFQVLLKGLDSYPDSLQSYVLQSISLLAPEKYNNNILKKFLFHSNLNVSGTAAYFYSRHPNNSVVSSLIRANIQPATLWDKYRLKALQRSIRKYHVQTGDSALFDSLKYRIISDLKNKSGSWQHQLYELSILQHFQDSTSFQIISRYLTDPNPHLRLSAINAIAQFDTIDAKSVLLQVYQEAEWSDKGNIILALARDNPEMTYNLIQKNLDKGHTHFKQLLLRSLSAIRNNMSLRQLRQFLLVPNVRLNITAYEELLKRGHIGYRQTKDLLLSGDMALATIATQSIISNPDWARFDDLSAAYAQYSEPQGVETLLALLYAMDLVASNESINFIEEIYKNTSSFMIAKKTEESLKKANVSLPTRKETPLNLFVPENLILQEEMVKATIETNKGKIQIQLIPFVAPVTVSNFVELSKKGGARICYSL